MNKEQIKKMIADDFNNLIKEKLDSAIIFKYINDIEKENQQLKEQLEKERKARKKATEHLELKIIRYSNEIDYMLNTTDLKEIIEILDIDKGE